MVRRIIQWEQTKSESAVRVSLSILHILFVLLSEGGGKSVGVALFPRMEQFQSHSLLE